MKRNALLIMTAILACLSSCDRKQPNPNEGPKVEENPYLTAETETFAIDFPRSWTVDTLRNIIRPFAACSSNEQQVLIVSTILHDDKSLEEFTDERIAAYTEQYRGFHLLEREVKDSTSFLRYETSDVEAGYHQYTIMRIDKHDTHFYGTDCVYETEAEKDTADYILKSMKFK